MRDGPTPPLPFELAGVDVDDRNGVYPTQADYPCAVRTRRQRIRMGPLPAVFQRADHVFFDIQVLP